MNRFYAGIDPGLNGSIAIFHESGAFVAVYDMPTFTDKKNKRHIDGGELKTILEKYKILHAYVENIHSSPQMGVTSAFSFGRSRGIIEGVLIGRKVACTMITPQRWKAYFRLTKKDKDLARERIIHMLPAHKKLFERTKDIDRAEACLICLTGMGALRKAEVVA